MVEQLITARDNMLNLLNDITLNPKPSYGDGDRSVSWADYQKFLLEGIKSLNEQIVALQPYEIRTTYIL